MRKGILLFLCLVLLSTFGVQAAPENQQACLTLYYQKDNIAFSQLSVGIYRVAEALPDGSYELIEPFASYPVSIHCITSQEQWQKVAQTLWSYIVANQTKPDREAKTDASGRVCFSDLETGLYLVREAVAETNQGTYLFSRFMVYLPTPQPDGSFQYQVEAKPKSTDFIPKTQYTVTKLWQDGGAQSLRPKQITVDIYQDGIWQESQVLSAANHWTYTWYVSEADQGQWTVAERSVPEPYKVTVKQNGGVFSIINTCPTRPNPPQTGDTLALLPLIVIMCISGMALLLLGLHHRRNR